MVIIQCDVFRHKYEINVSITAIIDHEIDQFMGYVDDILKIKSLNASSFII